jgi:preprotein translocase subunit YajC
LSLSILLAQTTPAPAGGGGFDLTFFLMMGGIFLVFYLLILRPQKKEQEEKQKAINALKKGDRVISIGGIHGSIVELDVEAGTAQVQVDRGVRLTFNRSALLPAKKEEPAKGGEAAKDSAGKKSA